MSNIYTIRPSDQESNNVKALMKHYKVGHATKALLLAAKDLPQLAKDHSELIDAYKKLSEDYLSLIQVIKERNAIESKINSLIETI